MGGLLSLSRAIDTVNMLLGRLAALLVLTAAVISAGNATMRYVFDYSSNAFLEVQWYLFAGVVLLGASNTLRLNEHVRVDLVYMSVSPRKRLWIDVFGIIFFLLPFSLFLAWLCWPIAWNAFRSGEMSSSAGGLPRWPVRMVIFLGFLLLAFQGLSELIKRIAALRGIGEVSTSYEKPLQ